MSKDKNSPEEKKKNEITVSTRKLPASKKRRERNTVTPVSPQEILRAFDNVFERFRSDFTDILSPSWDVPLAFLPVVRSPPVDLEDNEKEYVLKAEMPGFKKEEIEIEAQDNSIEITGRAGWKYNKKEQAYICKERACESFYRKVELPEEIKSDEIKANLSEGVLELTIPKKEPKPRRKIEIK